MTEPRTPLELVAFAAWINCPPDRIPAEYRQHTCEATMIAWRRVVEAIAKDAEAALRAERRMIVSHATMGETDGEGLSVNEISVKMVKPEPGAPAGGYPGSLEQMGYPAAPPPVGLTQFAKALEPTPASDAEHIVAAAVQIEGVTISLPRPARHGTILACISYSLNISPGRELQGFLTSTGRFVNRIQARHIADTAGQKPGRSGGRDNPELYSEDLW